MVHYNTVLVITHQCWNPIGLLLLYVYTFYSHNNTVWIANTEIGLDPNNSVIKRLRCTQKVSIILFAREYQKFVAKIAKLIKNVFQCIQIYLFMIIKNQLFPRSDS